MKYIVLIGDGMADRPLKELGGRTPLQAALTPNMDKLASMGICGMANTIPKGFEPGSDVANMSILGYDPAKYYSGRAPLEAASMGVELQDDDVAYRCNLVSLRYEKESSRAFMEDYSAGHIETRDARRLIESLSEYLRDPGIYFYPGISYRHLMIWRGGESGAKCIPPHDITGKDIREYMPTGPGSDFLKNLMRNSVDILQSQEYNWKRFEEGKNPANSIWLWGQGRKPRFPAFSDKYGFQGAMVSAVDLTKGLAICAGMKVLDVPGVTGYLDTNYEGKADYALKALAEDVDFVYIHVEAPDEAGHMGKYLEKIQAIEDFDSRVVGKVMAGARKLGDHRILMMPDHPTPIEVKTHTSDAVPFVIYDSTSLIERAEAAYSEDIKYMDEILKIESGHKLLDYFIKV
jgi:2,3-bisphosphoglycerate-independent phosphoglycerate mutase